MLANLTAHALRIIVSLQGRSSPQRMMEAQRLLTAGLNAYIRSRRAFIDTPAGKVLIADEIGDPADCEMITVAELEAILERARCASRAAREMAYKPRK